MDKFLMICYVAAEFGPKDGMMFSVKPNQIGVFVEAPEWIKDTLMFRWLLNDGSIKVADEHISKKQGENDPMKDITAEGKDKKVAKKPEEEPVAVEVAEEPVAEPVEEEKPKRKRTTKKADDAK